MCRIRRLLMMGARVPETCRAEYEYNQVLMILRVLCIWMVFYSLLSSLMRGTMNLKSTALVCTNRHDADVTGLISTPLRKDNRLGIHTFNDQNGNTFSFRVTNH
jgi:hypothetical protein